MGCFGGGSVVSWRDRSGNEDGDGDVERIALLTGCRLRREAG